LVHPVTSQKIVTTLKFNGLKVAYTIIQSAVYYQVLMQLYKKQKA